MSDTTETLALTAEEKQILIRLLKHAIDALFMMSRQDQDIQI